MIGISRFRRSCICSNQEWNNEIFFRPVITVCHIHQIVFSIIHMYDIPHMAFSIHATSQSITYNIILKRGQVTQILKCFRISFTYYFCCFISVKNINQLPRIAIFCIFICGRKEIIRRILTYFIFISQQLMIVIQFAGFTDYFSGIIRSCFYSSKLCAVCRIFCTSCIIR